MNIHPSITKRINGKTVWRRELKLGDVFATVATPTARFFGLDCIDPETQQLKPESRCNKTKEWLNDLFSPKTGEQMKTRVTVIYQIDASPVEAIQQALSGKVEPVNISTQIMPERAQPTPQNATSPTGSN